MGGGAGRGDRFFRMAECLVGEALIPEDERQEGVATHAGVEAITNGFGAVALGIVKREAFFQMPARRGEAAQRQWTGPSMSGLD